MLDISIKFNVKLDSSCLLSNHYRKKVRVRKHRYSKSDSFIGPWLICPNEPCLSAIEIHFALSTVHFFLVQTMQYKQHDTVRNAFRFIKFKF